MRYIAICLTITALAFFITAKSEASGSFNGMPYSQNNLPSPNFNAPFPSASQMAGSNLNFNAPANSGSRSNLIQPVQPAPVQTQSGGNARVFRDPNTGQLFMLVPVAQQPADFNSGAGPCPDFLGDTFACVKSPPNSQFFPPLTFTPPGGPCPDFLGDTFACVPSPANTFFPVFSQPFIFR